MSELTSLLAGDDVVGHLDLSQQPTVHRFEMEGRTLYTWCAWDSLFLPELLGWTARVRSTCPASGAEKWLEVAPTGVKSARPSSVVLSFRELSVTGEQATVIESFCRHVHSFRDATRCAAWTNAGPGTLLISLESAFELGRRLNAARYRDVPTDD